MGALDELLAPLPVLAPLARYEEQAQALLAAHQARDPLALATFHRCHPRFLDPVVTWKPREVAPGEIAAAALGLDDARLAVARGYSFRDWAALTQLALELARPGSPVRDFELAAEAVITGDLAALERALAVDPGLVRARSTRVTCHDPAVHRSTLLHYLAANGTEGYRQRSPANAVAVARLLLGAGAEVDALAGLYGGEFPTLTLLVSSSPPRAAGVQVPLTETLLEFGAAIDGVGESPWRSPLRTALAFGFVDVAEVLVRRRARVDALVPAAGLGRTSEVARLLSSASPEERHGALALAAQLGHADVVRLLAERGARLDLRDKLWNGTPLGWARHANQLGAIELLASLGGA
jgi:hypothetical protein